MKKLLSILFLFSFCFGFAQTKDSLSVEEQQRREKNIQTGNPFKKFGYKPKIHTLSKGKYLEFHDLDSIVKIGSYSYHVKTKSITGYSEEEETKYSEATLRPEIVSRWFSPDPLSDEFPNESPYVFVGNSPIVYVDPDGRFKIPIHKRILLNAFNSSGLDKGFLNFFQSDVKLGVTVEADVLGFASDYHFDNRQNYSEVQSTWSSLNSEIDSKISDLGSFNKKFGGDDAVLFGRMLHTVQDFYSHSNYVELYIDYFKTNNDGAIPDSVPTYDVGIQDKSFNKILQNGLRTGDFDFIDNEVTNPDGSKAQSPTSHNKMNKDKADTLAGKLAEKVATDHTAKILSQLKKKE